MKLVATGLIMKDYFDELNISQKDACKILGISQKHLSNLFRGKVGLTANMAVKFERLIPEISASYWLNYEMKYREQKARGTE